jgi:hypothetical protein
MSFLHGWQSLLSDSRTTVLLDESDKEALPLISEKRNFHPEINELSF